MHHERLIVLKFGGSVLRSERTLQRAVHEIHRWRREDHRVVAVVSALAGETDRLFARCDGLSPRTSPYARASVVANGEATSAALLGLLLDRAGIPARVLSAGALALTATGDALDAEPVDVDVDVIYRALALDEAVIVPGYVAQDDDGRTVLLGRGGSDLSALFLADRLRATRCILVKDVDGLYERDPSAPGPRPARFARVSWDDALETDGSIVQHKALRFARSRRLRFELGGPNGEDHTLVDAGPTERARSRRSRTPRPLRVALLGLGTVGSGVAALLDELSHVFELCTVLVRDPQRERDVDVAPARVTNDEEVVLEGVDVVVEALGGVEVPRRLIARALASGIDVVTANKAVLAEAADELERLARRTGARLLHSASVGGCAPLLERLARSEDDVVELRGVLNGTVNFVLDELASGVELDAALARARELGLAEADASRDLSGRDAADKLIVAARLLGYDLASEDVAHVGLEESLGLVRAARHPFRCPVRQVATLVCDEGRAVARVAFEELARDDPLANARGEGNVVEVRFGGASDRVRVVAGKGAGRWPTAESIVGDLLELARDDPRCRAERERSALSASPACVRPPSRRTRTDSPPARASTSRRE